MSQTNPLLKQYCSNHQAEQLTNFCSNADCLKPLCPECIDAHTKYHAQLKTSADIDSLKNVKLMCSKKVNTGIQEIQKILSDAEHYGLNENEDQAIKEIRKGKEIVIDLVNQYFHQMEEQYKSHIESQSNSQQTFNQLQENIKTTMNELEHLNLGLESSNLLTVIKKVCQLDLKRTLLKYRKTIKNLQSINNSTQGIVQLNQFNLQHIPTAIANYATLNYVPLNNSVFLSSSHITQMQDTYLQQNDYFKSKLKLLHFFEVGTSRLWLYDLGVSDTQWRPIQISNYIEVLPYSKSTIAPDGSIYLAGGSLANNKKSGKIYQFNFSNYQLQEIGQMTYSRSSQGMIWKDNELYFIGGYLDNVVMTQFCEAFDCINKRSRRLPNLNIPIASPGGCVFNGCITIMGGQTTTLKINQTIEFLMMDRWVSCVIQSQLNSLASMMCGIQIDQNQLMIFGGYFEGNKGSQECTILEITENQGKVIDSKQLPYAEGFWNNTPVIYQGKVWALQNVIRDVSGNCAFDSRRIITFNGQFWK